MEEIFYAMVSFRERTLILYPVISLKPKLMFNRMSWAASAVMQFLSF